MINVTQNIQVTGNCKLLLPCRNCNTESMAPAYRVRNDEQLYGLFAIWSTSETTIVCPSCGTVYVSKLDLGELLQLSPQELSNRLKARMAFGAKFAICIAWLLIFIGPVSLIVFVITRFHTPQAATGWRFAINIGTLLAALIAIVQISLAIVYR